MDLFKVHTPQFGFKSRFLLPLCILTVCIVSDRLTKQFALSTLVEKSGMDLIPGMLGLVYVENTGMAFGLFNQSPYLLAALRIIGMLIVLWFILYGGIQSIWGFVSLSMILSGGIGNIIDVFLYGYVIDMFEFQFVNFAIFNVADIFITVGAVLLGVYMLFLHTFVEDKKENHAEPEDLSK